MTTPLSDIRLKLVVVMAALDDPLSFTNPSEVVRKRIMECLHIIDSELGDEHG